MRVRTISLLSFCLLLIGLSLTGCGKKNEPTPPGGPTEGVGRPYPRS